MRSCTASRLISFRQYPGYQQMMPENQLMESLKEEARTGAMSYINEILDDAKLTASREAKRIVVQAIQRVAAETAIENAVDSFSI